VRTLSALIFFNIILALSSAMSAVALKGVGGVSYFDATANKIYAGTTGPCSGGGSTSSTCNTCTDTISGSLKPCNQKNIHGALRITFSVESSTDLTGKTILLSVGTNSTITQLSTTPGGPAGAAISISATWSQFCAQVTGLDSSCAMTTAADQLVSTDKSFFIDVDENGNGSIDTATERTGVSVSLQAISTTNTALHSQNYCSGGAGASYGLCFYSLATGDQKLIILGSPAPLSNSTTPGGSPDFQAVAFFAFPQAAGISTTGISNGLVSPVIKTFVSATDLSIQGDPYLSGLSNYQRYCVFAGQMNLAQNIFGFTTLTPDVNQMCKETSEVVGILDGKHCFISTAAFGSDMAKEVQILRKFRDTFLLTNHYGIEFVKWYYKYGPKAAAFIADSEALKFIVRVTLYPFVGFAWVAINYGI